MKFAALFGAILVASNLSKIYYGSSGLYAISAISGITDVDAINLSLSTMYESGNILVAQFILGLFIAISVNNLMKSLVTFFSRRKLGILTGLGLVLINIPMIIMVITNV